MSECICGKQSVSGFMHIIDSKCRAHDGVLDPWNYTGNPSWDKSDKPQEFLALCKDKLPKKDLPIRIGHTGYVNANKDIFQLPNSWSHDELGRMVILLDGLLMFERYIHGDLIMGSKDGSSFSAINRDRFQDFLKQLEDKQPVESDC